MPCSCGGPSCNCLEKCCCSSEFCVCTACFNLRNTTIVKNEGSRPMESFLNLTSDSQKSDDTNTYCHLKDEELIQISSSCDESESDVVFTGWYVNKEVKKYSSPSVFYPEIVLTDSEEDNPVLIDEVKDDCLKITPENTNSGRNLGDYGGCHFSNKGEMSKRKRRVKSWKNRKLNKKKKAKVSKFRNRSYVSLEQHEDCVVFNNIDVQVNVENVTENSNFNRYFSVESSNCSAYDEEIKATLESSVSNVRNNSLKFESSASKSQENETTQESPVPNIRNKSLNSETNRCINENTVSENSNFNRYFSEIYSSLNVSNDQKNKIMQETPLSNIRNDSFQFERNKCGLLTDKSYSGHKKIKFSLTKSRLIQNGEKMFFGMETTLQSDQESFSFNQQADLTSATPNVMQTNEDGASKSSTFHRSCQLNFPVVNECDFNEENIVRNFPDQCSLTCAKSHKRHMQSDNSGELGVNIHPAVSHSEYFGNKSLQNVDEAESSCNADKNKRVSFLLPSSQSSSEICKDYQEHHRNSFQDIDGGESSCTAVEHKHFSFTNPNGDSYDSFLSCSECQANYEFFKRIRMKMLRRAKRGNKKRTGQINKFTRKKKSTINKLRRKRKGRKRNVSRKVGPADLGHEMKRENIDIKRETKKNPFVKKEIEFVKREIKEEKP